MLEWISDTIYVWASIIGAIAITIFVLVRNKDTHKEKETTDD